MAPSTNGHNGVHHEADEMIDTLYAWMPGLRPAPQACPEALFSCTMEGAIDGHKTLLTARGQSAAEFKANLQAIRGLLDPPQAPVQAASQDGAPIKDWCAGHQTRMYLNQKDGRSWYSHRLPEGGFCKGK
jgi:hypothetical protein